MSAPRGSLQSLRLTVNGAAATYRLTGGSTGAVQATADGTDLCLSDRTSPRGSAAATAGDIRLSQSGAHFGGKANVTVQVANARRLREPPGWRDDSGMRSMGTAGEGG